MSIPRQPTEDGEGTPRRDHEIHPELDRVTGHSGFVPEDHGSPGVGAPDPAHSRYVGPAEIRKRKGCVGCGGAGVLMALFSALALVTLLI